MAGGGFDAFPECSAEAILASMIESMKAMNANRLTLSDMFGAQRAFMSKFHDLDKLSPPEREELTKTLVLSLHGEATSLANCVNYRDHHPASSAVNVSLSNLTHEAVDIVRYTLGVLNTWGVSPQEFGEAFIARDNFLNTRQKLSERKYSGQPTVIVDMDDVIVGFRDGFTDWLETQGVYADRNSTEYYYVSSLTGCKDFNSERYYQTFIEEHGLRDKLPPNLAAIDVVNRLHDAGFWVQILTARPGNNLTCVYDTYEWLANNGVKFDRLDFAGEKFLWLMKSEPYDASAVVCALEDSPKHAIEYARHGVQVFAPVMSYNKVLELTQNVTVYTTTDTLFDDIISLAKRLHHKLEI